jgi:hypothetical protein
VRFKDSSSSWLWCCTLVISVLESLREEDKELEASLRLIVRPCLKNQNKNTKSKNKMKKGNGNHRRQTSQKNSEKSNASTLILPWCLSGERMVIYISGHLWGGPQVDAVHLE